MNLADSALTPSPCSSSPHLPVLTWPGSLLSTPLSTGVRILGFLVGPCSCPPRSTLRFRLAQTRRGGAWGVPAPLCFLAQGVHAPRGSLGPSSGLSPPTHTTVPGGACIHTVRISRPVHVVPGESRSCLTEDIVRVLCSKALR